MIINDVTSSQNAAKLCLFNNNIQSDNQENTGPKSHIEGFLWGDPPKTSGFPSQRASDVETVIHFLHAPITKISKPTKFSLIEAPCLNQGAEAQKGGTCILFEEEINVL